MSTTSRKVDSVISFLGFMGPFFLMFPFFFLFSLNKNWYKYGYGLNRIWAKIFFWVSRVKTEVEYRGNIQKNGVYVYAPNHSSYLDIPTMGLHFQGLQFVGKNSLEKVPVFGYMYRKLHITVDRENRKSTYSALMRSMEAVDQKHNLVMFPEGGIRTTNPPRMTRYKDGPFRVAIEKQIPLVPVTIPFNWIALPDDGKFLLNRKAVDGVKVIFHEPISTKGMKIEQLEELKKQTFRIINRELEIQNNLEEENGD